MQTTNGLGNLTHSHNGFSYGVSMPARSSINTQFHSWCTYMRRNYHSGPATLASACVSLCVVRSNSEGCVNNPKNKTISEYIPKTAEQRTGRDVGACNMPINGAFFPETNREMDVVLNCYKVSTTHGRRCVAVCLSMSFFFAQSKRRRREGACAWC